MSLARGLTAASASNGASSSACGVRAKQQAIRSYSERARGIEPKTPSSRGGSSGWRNARRASLRRAYAISPASQEAGEAEEGYNDDIDSEDSDEDLTGEYRGAVLVR